VDRTIAFIPVRGGSKSIPGKNIKRIAGRPLVYWVLDAAVQCNLIDKVYVATDDPQIAEVVAAHGSGKVAVCGRSPETSTDTASTESAMIEFARGRDFEQMVLIQATSPLLTASDLEGGLRKFFTEKADAVVSVVRQKRFIWKESGTGQAVPENYDPANRPRRQDFDGFLVENGAFYVCKRSHLISRGTRLSGHIIAHEMPEETYFEVDEPADWLIMEHLLAARKKERVPADTLKDIKLFLMDVDGVLTDSGMYYSEQGDELKKFNTRDGKGIELLREMGIKVGIITSEDRKIVKNRADKLKLDFLYMGAQNKLSVLKEILSRTGIPPRETAFIGDDVNDLEVLGHSGFSAVPADATAKNKAVADYVCGRKGGEGCVREIADLILEAKSVSSESVHG
jgi:N-acylneuraminate cytidylyltransferase